ncbi:hypothetical protein B1A99_05040 [Cohnella sp. CIP 111063]|uniref:hypothetical protein n=1 Tax=unclassified Cohnella TaxID=2636738 RepID=UPI000B8C6179|nr:MULTISPECIES: hypothetical protein [unclassified Cohnella]OXS60902.1 hypothetical protein B1A99_05040 [Cohnella sp. CIP 111063]PRX73430.1 hypothetical protein B0G52_10327 [Cohnella sp. SGD-V74]
MATMMTDWEVVTTDDARSVRLCEEFGERYGFTAGETTAFKLCLLYGLSDEEIVMYAKMEPEALSDRLACMMGKTRTRTSRELQALFLRYMLNRLPA